MKHSRAASPQPYALILTGAVAILVPLLLTLAWGLHFPDEVYMGLSISRKLAEGAGLALSAVGRFPFPTLQSPLFAFVVSIPARIGIEPGLAALILSTVGWSTAALSFLAIGQSLKRICGAMTAALLLSFNPAIITTLGSPASWIVALGWLTLALFRRRRLGFAALTFLLLIALLIPWPLNRNGAHLTHYAGPIAWSILLFAAGVGGEWLAGELVKRDRVHLPYSQLSSVLLAIVFILFGVWQGSTLWQLFRDKPLMSWQLEEDVAAWLQSETEASATLLANESTGYLAQRSLATFPDLPQLETATAVQTLLQQQPVNYVVTSNELPWQQLQELIWFRLAYEPVKQFNSPHLPQAPFTIWAYRQPLPGLGQRYTFNARVPDRLWIIGYQIGPQQVRAGESIEMALYIEAPEATSEAPTPFQVIVRLISPIDYSTVQEWSVDLPNSISVEDWQANEVIVEQFPLEMPDELEAGAYLLNLSLLGPEADELWPLSLDNDFNRLDRVPTGAVIVPTDEKLEGTQLVEAAFDNDIQLYGFTTSGGEAGENLDVTLAWQAQQPVTKDYVVFVHLIDSSGQLAANHDGIPGHGRFPTRAWQPGLTIPDTHTIELPLDMPTGEYVLKAGLYDPDTGQRLAATSADGKVAEDSAIILTTISIP